MKAHGMTQLALHAAPKMPGSRVTQVTADGRIYDRWEPTPKGVERGTWGRAWIGVVTVAVRSATPDATAAELRSWRGEKAAGEAFVTAMCNDGTLQGDPEKLGRDLYRCDPTVTANGDLVTYRQDVEIQQDFGPEPTREEEREGWFRLTGQYPKTVADLSAVERT